MQCIHHQGFHLLLFCRTRCLDPSRSALLVRSTMPLRWVTGAHPSSSRGQVRRTCSCFGCCVRLQCRNTWLCHRHNAVSKLGIAYIDDDTCAVWLCRPLPAGDPARQDSSRRDQVPAQHVMPMWPKLWWHKLGHAAWRTHMHVAAWFVGEISDSMCNQLVCSTTAPRCCLPTWPGIQSWITTK